MLIRLFEFYLNQLYFLCSTTVSVRALGYWQCTFYTSFCLMTFSCSVHSQKLTHENTQKNWNITVLDLTAEQRLRVELSSETLCYSVEVQSYKQEKSVL